MKPQEIRLPATGHRQMKRIMKSKAWRFLVPLVAGSLAIEAAQFGDFEYESSGTNITITRYIGLGGAVTIPGTINGLTVTSIGEHAFRRDLRRCLAD
jgi:hypothetical protein